MKRRLGLGLIAILIVTGIAVSLIKATDLAMGSLSTTQLTPSELATSEEISSVTNIPQNTVTPFVRKVTNTPEPTAAPLDCDGDYLVFSSFDDWSNQEKTYPIFVGCSDGTGVREIAVLSTEVIDLAVSPDGSKLAITTSRRSKVDLYIYDLLNEKLTSLIADEASSIYKIDWSPDSEYLAYIVASSEQSRPTETLEVMHLETGTLSHLLDQDDFTGHNEVAPGHQERFSYFDWAPIGQQVVAGTAIDATTGYWFTYYFDIQCNEDTHLCSASTPSLVKGLWLYPVWSPDGLLLASTSLGDSGNDLLLLTGADGQVMQVIDLSGLHGVDALAWSPDGSQIVLLAQPDALTYEDDIFVLRLSDLELVNITSDKGVYQSAVDWAPESP